MSKKFTPEFEQFNQFLAQKPQTYTQSPINKNLFAYILSEYFKLVQEKNKHLKDNEYITTCEDSLQRLGIEVGYRIWEAFLLKNRLDQTQKQQEVFKSEYDVLKLIQKQFWAYLFGDDAAQNTQLQVMADQKGFYFVEQNPITDCFISYPKDYKGIYPSAILSGVIQSCLSSSGFECRVKVFLNQGLTYHEILSLKK